MTIETREAARWIKCVCCSAQIRTCEKFLQVVKDNGKDARGEKYCVHCEKYARLNNDISDVPSVDCEEGLREREAYAAYQASGCTAAYWEDRDAGYI